MRIAVALPSLEPDAPLRRSIDGMLERIVAAGHDVEGFAEHDRSGDTTSHPLFHYLRMPERHRARRFDTALYPLGRDATPYQSVFFLMNHYPGAVWFLDPIVHHLAVGGVALMGDWASYRELLDRAYGPTGAAVAQTVAANWGTGALFRRYDLVAALADGQPAVLAAWPALAARLGGRLEGRQIGVVPLGDDDAPPTGAQRGNDGKARRPGQGNSAEPLVKPRTGGEPVASESGAWRGPGPVDIAIMTVNESYATTAVRVAAEALEVAPEARVRICLSEPIYKAEAVKVARHRGIEGRLGWELTTSPARLAEVAAASTVLVWLAEELQGGHRLLLLDGLAAGKLTLVPRCDLYDDLPDGVVAKLDLGRVAAPTVAAMLEAFAANAELREGMAAAGRAFAAARPTVDDAASAMLAELESLAAAQPLEARPVSDRTWRQVARRMRHVGLPGGAGGAAEKLLAEVLGRETEGFRRS